MGPSDPQLGPIGALIILIAILALIGYSAWGLYHWHRDWRHWRRHQPTDDGQPADLTATLASIDQMEQQGRL